MKIKVLTLFKEAFETLNHSIIKRAINAGRLEVEIIDIRDYSKNKHKKCDDYPFGGGAGMVMTPQPIYDAIISNDLEHKARRIYLSPKGSVLNQAKVEEFAKDDELLLLCGHYEGVDQRIIDNFIDEEISIGDYVLTGGELPAMVLIDSIARYVPDVLGSQDSLKNESFSDNLLEYPQYTRPENFLGYKVPEVLLSGNHKEIENWRKEKQKEETLKKRPDLLEEKINKDC